jgi:transcriptional regulator with XRE-family HTH domain
MTIPAHFERTSQAHKQRQPRRKLLLDAQGTPSSGEATDVLIHNISATGLLIECGAELKSGETIEVDLPQAGPTSAGIVWASGRLFGCEFDAPISEAALSAARLRSAIKDSVDLAEAPALQEPFGNRLQRLRKARGLTLADLAAQLDVTKPTVWAWEKGRARPLDDRIDDLARALGVPSSDLVTGQDSTALQNLIARCRVEIARACGAGPDKVRIFVEL